MTGPVLGPGQRLARHSSGLEELTVQWSAGARRRTGHSMAVAHGRPGRGGRPAAGRRGGFLQEGVSRLGVRVTGTILGCSVGECFQLSAPQFLPP